MSNSLVKKESSDTTLISATLNSMYNKLDAMNLVLNSVICRLAEITEDYGASLGGSPVYSNILDWQKELNTQIAQILSDINGLHEQYNALMTQAGVSPKNK